MTVPIVWRKNTCLFQSSCQVLLDAEKGDLFGLGRGWFPLLKVEDNGSLLWTPRAPSNICPESIFDLMFLSLNIRLGNPTAACC